MHFVPKFIHFFISTITEDNAFMSSSSLSFQVQYLDFPFIFIDFVHYCVVYQDFLLPGIPT